MSGSWRIYARCSCGWRTPAPFGDLYHVHFEVCPRCGALAKEFVKETARWISASKWWWPPSWGKGRWETKEK